MKPSDELIEIFRKCYYEEFKEELTTAQAHEKFMRVVNLVRVVLRPRSTKEPGTMFSGVFIPGIDDFPKDGNIKHQ